ncbi:MAG: LPS-assembly protein LptD [Elusimicrobia bacterium]|nr:LPS-assembly protein LptD [Elusimicrobiota bacterium]
MIAALLAIFLAAPARSAETDYPLPPAPAASSATITLTFSADHMDYSSATALIHLQGRAIVRQSSWTLKADDLWINPETERGTARGFFIVSDTWSAVSGTGGSFNFASRQAVMDQAAAGSGNWRVHAREGVIRADRSIDYYHAHLTSCNIYPHPHYYFYTSHLTVVPGHYLLARNAVFYLGRYHPVPLFYTPFFYKSIKSGPELSLFEWKARPGYDKRNGYFLDNTITSRWNRSFYTKAYADYYGQQGAGAGGEIDDHESRNSRGTVYGYQINERSSPDLRPLGGQERWEVLGERYQALTKRLSFHGRLQAMSDPLFNNDYARASLYPFTSEINNSAAMTYAAGAFTAHLSYSRVDLANAAGTGFQKVSESAPRVDVQSISFTLWKLPWLNTLSGFQDNTYAQGQGFIQHSGGVGWQGTQAIHLARGLSLRPQVSYNAAYYNKYFVPFNNSLYNFTSPATQVYVSSPLANSPLYADALINRYSVSNDLRWESQFGYWDAIHAMTFRSRPGSFAVDESAPDYGLEQNLVTLQDAFRPAPKVWASLGSGYNLQQLSGYNLVFHQRVLPITGDISYSPGLFESVDLRDQYVAGAGNQSFVADAQWGDPRGAFVAGGAGYNLQQADEYYTDARFGWISPGGRWHFVGALYAGLSSPGGISRAGRFSLFDKELQVVKLWHDFIGRAGFMWRPGGAKVARVSVSLRLGHSPEAVAQALRENYWESEWYPQRATDIAPGR